MKWLPVPLVLVLFGASPAWADDTEPSRTQPDETGGLQPTTEVTEEDVGIAMEEAEGQPRPLIGLDLTLASTYVFRGELQYASPVIPSIQPSVTLSFAPLLPGDLEIGFWSAFAMADRSRVRREATATELDLSLMYSNSVADGWLELGGGFLYYLYPGEEQVDGEKELVLSLDVGHLPISLGMTGYFEVHPGLGLVLEPHMGWEQAFGRFNVGVDLLLGASFDREQPAELDYVTLVAGVSHQVDRLTVGLDLSYTLRLAPGGLDFLDRSLLYGSVSLSWAR